MQGLRYNPKGISSDVKQPFTNSVHGFQECSTKFITHFLGARKHSKPSTHLLTIKQKSSESLKDYASCFNQESLKISDLNEGDDVAASYKEWPVLTVHDSG